MRCVWSSVYLVGLAIGALGCADKERTPEPKPTVVAADGGMTRQPVAAGSSGSMLQAAMCMREPGCEDLNTSFFSYPACCTAKYACGYELSYDDAFVMVYPQIRDVLANLAQDDPNGKCVPERYLFPVRPGTYDHRVELPGAEENDILVAEQCESRGVTVFTMPGCCMPDNHCGISTDEVAPTFQVLLEGDSAAFSEPECLSADELNAQLKQTKLAAFARIPSTSGATCDHAALAKAVPRYRQPGR